MSGHKKHFPIVPGTQEGRGEDVGVPSVGVVSDGGPGPFPSGPAWSGVILVYNMSI